MANGRQAAFRQQDSKLRKLLSVEGSKRKQESTPSLKYNYVTALCNNSESVCLYPPPIFQNSKRRNETGNLSVSYKPVRAVFSNPVPAGFR